MPGRITRALVKLGDQVRAGQPLYEMSSPEFYATVREFNENRIAEQAAAKNLERREAMHAAGIASAADAQAAKLDATARLLAALGVE